ncbi:PorT family protein [Hymenobacter sp. BT683]|uniref:PorT family protein n=1 Tax=Hymenobacter jeongseonensis TaxID=2791027 RepID=A0ABS0IDM2_9BACT|nr:porin family protein [Hymenobacter jeongseonensis]MBF9236460.1 PorT family protein [Hymenobacter jeongseonensis]
MKKVKMTILCCLLVGGFQSLAQAQTRDVSLGLKAGVSYSKLVGAEAVNYSSTRGYHAGIFATIGLRQWLSFGPELLYSQKGAAAQSSVGDFQLHYIELPLPLRMNVNGLFLEAGPQFAYLAKVQGESSNPNPLTRSNFKSLDMGYLVGFGYQRHTGLGIGLRYVGQFTKCLLSVNYATAGYVASPLQARNRAFQAYLSYTPKLR